MGDFLVKTNKMPILEYKNTQPTLGKNIYIAPNSYIIGDVVAGDNTSFWFNVTVRGDVNNVIIGDNTNVQDGSVIHVTRKTCPTVIGNNVTIGHSVTLHGCTIKDNCLIGMGAIILDRAVINKNTLIAAGSLVPEGKEYPEGVLLMGSPAKVKRELTQEEIDFFEISANNYIRLKDEYLE